LKERDAFFQELFGRPPTVDEVRRFDRLGILTAMKPDDTMWYVILVNEFYDDRLRSRLAELDRVADSAADMAIARLAESVGAKADALAERRHRGYLWRSWGFFLGLLVTFCSGILSAGYVMGGGKDPFWLAPENSFERVSSWFLNVPAGWIFLLGCAPFLLETFLDSFRKLWFGLGGKGGWEQTLLWAKTACAFVGLVFVFLVTLAF
jgi:hypothetical protein